MNEENKSKTTNRNYFLIIIILILIYAFVVVRTFANDNTTYFVGGEKNTFLICSLLLGFVFYSTIYQLGKALFAKIAGFKIISINIICISFKFIEKKVKIGFDFSDNFVGNVEVIPNNDEKCKPILFHLGGLISFIFVALLASIIASFIDKKIMYIILSSTIMNIIVLMIQIIPVYMDFINDGLSIILLLNKNNHIVYYNNLRQNAALKYNIGELRVYEYSYYDTLLNAEALMYNYYFYMIEKNYNKAIEVLDLLVANSKYLQSENVLLSKANKTYFVLLSKNDNECYDYFYSLSKEIRKYISSPSNFEVLKIAYLVSCKVDKTYDMFFHINKIENKIKDTYDNIVYASEKERIKESKEIAYSLFPDWKD